LSGRVVLESRVGPEHIALRRQLRVIKASSGGWAFKWGRPPALFGASVGASMLAMDAGSLRGVRCPALSLATIAGKPAPTGLRGVWGMALLVAMGAGSPWGVRCPALSLATIASKPAPTGLRGVWGMALLVAMNAGTAGCQVGWRYRCSHRLLGRGSGMGLAV